MRSKLLTEPFIVRALSNTSWDFGNQVLYDMCRREPLHEKPDIAIGKLWLIGRTYAAAIERRRVRGETAGDAFYTDRVAPVVCRSGLDNWLAAVHRNPDDMNVALEAHAKLTALFSQLTGLSKISLASKYLHFHAQSAFYIYDSRAATGIQRLTRRLSPDERSQLRETVCDSTYGEFFMRCNGLAEELRAILGRRVTPREVDKVLLAVAEQ
jgi:hypothetical protein